MFKFFNREKEQEEKEYIEKKELNDITNRYDKIIKELKEEVSEQRRIIKYSKEVPTFNLNYDYRYRFMLPSTREFTVDLYINKNEYCIYLKELDDESISDENCRLNINDNLAYFDVDIVKNYNGEHKTLCLKFIIDYSKSTYVVTSE